MNNDEEQCKKIMLCLFKYIIKNKDKIENEANDNNSNLIFLRNFLWEKRKNLSEEKFNEIIIEKAIDIIVQYPETYTFITSSLTKIPDEKISMEKKIAIQPDEYEIQFNKIYSSL